ncbi:glycerate kinase [Corynebacterium mucifaciens]|nr:glycerate kinase [Corynebacterium mucifaciens]
MTSPASAPFDPAPSPKVVVAPDSFKSTATAAEAAEWLAEGVRSVIRDAQILLTPMADGGEGTSALFEGERVSLPTTTAAGRLTEAEYTYHAATKTAYIDVSAASGLPAVQDDPVPLTGDTYGTGVLIADAQTRGAERIVLGLGGTATNDGGTGILVALGVNPLDQAGYQLTPGGGALERLTSFDTAKVNVPAGAVEWVLLTDTSAPAAGPEGAAHVFAPQKGATDADVEVLDRGLARLCEVADVDPATPGLGAAGGVGIGITWLSTLLHGDASHVHVLPGARVVAESNGLTEHIDGAALVITGEGRYDGQTGTGKVASVVGELAREAGAVFAVAAGRFDEQPADGSIAVTLPEADDVREQLIQAGAEIAVAYLNTSTVQG